LIMRVMKGLSSDCKAVSLLVEYVMIAGILTIFMFFIVTQLNGIFIETPTKVAMKNQFEDIGNQIVTKLVDIALIAPENGNVKVKLYMPYRVGDYDFKAGFIERSGEYLLELTSERLGKTEYIPLSNIALEVIPEGYTFSLSLTHELTYTSSSHVAPTAVALAYPSTVRVGDNVTFDMTYSTGEGNLQFTWEFGDGNSYTGSYNPDNPDGALVQHSYAAAGNYTANLTVWDNLGFSDTDSINITVEALTPDPFLYADKFVIPEVTSPNEQVKITLYVRGGGIVEQARNVSVIHVIDVSGSMDPDLYGDNGYTIYNSTSGIAYPSKWDGSVIVDNTFRRMRIYAYSTGKDIDLWVKSPDGDFARAQYLISNGELYYVSNPEAGEWSIAVVADYPTGSDTVTVKIQKKIRPWWWAPWIDVASYNFLLSANAEIFTISVPLVENLKIDVDPVNGTKTLHLWVENPSGALYGPYSSSSGYETTNAEGNYIAYVVADFPYGSQEFDLKSYIAKIDAAKIAAKTFNGFLTSNDRVGVAYFNGTGSWGSIPKFEVVQTLTSNTDDANSSIDGLSAFGGTPMGGGIWIGKEELVARTPLNSIPVIVLLSDGNPTLPTPESYAIQLAIDNATDAKSTVINGENILIYTIGFGGDANETLLKQIATSPSYYQFAATADELKSIYEQIARELKEKAATNLTITDVLPENIELSSTPEGANVTYSDGRTIIQWNISAIKINETWSVSFYVTPKEEGTLQTNVEFLSNITFLPYPFNESVTFRTIYFPKGEIRVERLGTERVELK
jgi:hypothetical protein